MKLDMGCVRDVLLELEGLPIDIHTPHSFPDSISKHGINNVEYALAKLSEGLYLNANIERRLDGHYDFYGIYDMTFSGHEFLENIRDDKVWNKTKGVLKKAGASSFSLATQVASQVLAEIVKTLL